jgi:hypothetical protein
MCQIDTVLERGIAQLDIPRNSSTPFQIDRGSRHGDQHACNPDEQGQSNTACQLQDGARGCKDTRSDNSIENQERSTDDSDLPPVVGRAVEDIAFVCAGNIVSKTSITARTEVLHT